MGYGFPMKGRRAAAAYPAFFRAAGGWSPHALIPDMPLKLDNTKLPRPGECFHLPPPGKPTVSPQTRLIPPQHIPLRKIPSPQPCGDPHKSVLPRRESAAWPMRRRRSAQGTRPDPPRNIAAQTPDTPALQNAWKSAPPPGWSRRQSRLLGR